MPDQIDFDLDPQLADPDLLGGGAPDRDTQLGDPVAVDDQLAQPRLAAAQRRGLDRDVGDHRLAVADVDAAVGGGGDRQRRGGDGRGGEQHDGGSHEQTHAARILRENHREEGRNGGDFGSGQIVLGDIEAPSRAWKP